MLFPGAFYTFSIVRSVIGLKSRIHNSWATKLSYEVLVGLESIPRLDFPSRIKSFVTDVWWIFKTLLFGVG